MRGWKVFAATALVSLAITYASPEISTARAQNLTINIPGTTLTDIVEIVEDAVPGLSTVVVFTVPASRILVITDVVISNDSTNPATGQRIFRSGAPATAFITVAPQSAFSHTFATGIIFTAGSTVAVRNGNGVAGDTRFYLRGYLLAAP